jgi:hypothetical protein
MHGKTTAELKKYHQQKMAMLMATTMVSNETAFHAIDEATLHVIDHFNPKEIPDQRRDHCLIIGQAYFGKSTDDCDKNVSATAVFMAGDIHQLSHTMADTMAQDPAFKQVIIHALEVYNRLPKPEQSN